MYVFETPMPMISTIQYYRSIPTLFSKLTAMSVRWLYTVVIAREVCIVRDVLYSYLLIEKSVLLVMSNIHMY